MMSSAATANTRADYPSPRRAWGVTLLLTVVFVFSFVDRQILNLLVGPIQQDLDLSDTQVSLLQGLGFVATYVLLSIPIGRLVDTRRRTSIIACGVAFWSFATAACGMARGFTGLFVARAGVGVGEATLTPAAWSLLADYFPPDRRSLPFSVFLMGPYLGVGIAMIAGGLVMDGLAGTGPIEFPIVGMLAPWQATFFAVAAPGVILTALLMLVPEPSRKGLSAGAVPEAASFPDILAWVGAHHRVYVALLVGVPCIVLVLYGLQAWVPTYLLRVHGMSLGEAGTQYGSIALIAGSLGVLSGPFAGRYLERLGYRDYQLRVCVLVLALIGPGLAALAVAPTAPMALACIALVSYLVPLPLALIATALQNATPNQMRGVLVGAYVVTTNVIGLALGPSLVALATDYLFGDPAAVGKSLAVVGVAVSVAGLFLVGRALAPYRALLDSQSTVS
ncbi:spinster family MFS transporter [Pseudohaliea rubra]|uniref:Permease of the major facilitator superfamily n=1 Tax=Pseudohaliea rubra DSM 19751 TaxID=1265313 RepID=A0A095VPJ8_9GAMM|nr:MFS transporter [Pseudohaliea rubra]KGE03028.1 Permease of the major facilitator superfamily [Pseudohaliea rubra DSM 19751]